MRKALLALASVAALAAVIGSTALAATQSVVHLSALVSGLRYDQKVVHAHAGRIKIIFLNREGTLWTGGLHQVYLYRMEGVQTKKIAGGRKAGE